MRAEIPTREQSVLSFLESIPGPVHVVFEEGTQAQWLFDLMQPLVASVTVCRLVRVAGNDSVGGHFSRHPFGEFEAKYVRIPLTILRQEWLEASRLE